MKKIFIMLIMVFMPLSSTFADNTLNCELCTTFIGLIEKNCSTSTNCNEEQTYEILMNTAQQLPASVKPDAVAIIELYGYLMIELYLEGEKTPLEICQAIKLCDGGGGGGSPCDPCVDCSSTDWSSLSTGYESMIEATCNCGVCSKTTVYRCAAGYYGSSTNGTSGCTRCPAASGVYGTSAAGSTLITNCYIPKGNTGQDETGSFTYMRNCYYTE